MLRSLTTVIAVALCAWLLLWAAQSASAASDRNARHLRSTVHPCLAAIIDKENQVGPDAGLRVRERQRVRGVRAADGEARHEDAVGRC